MGFKITVHKNGAKHGEAHYSSEAVAVGMATKMRNAGADVSVARCNGACCCETKSNPAKAVMWTKTRFFITGAVGEGASYRALYRISTHGGTYAMKRVFRLEGKGGEPLGEFTTLAAAKAAAEADYTGTKSNPRRNGTKAIKWEKAYMGMWGNVTLPDGRIESAYKIASTSGRSGVALPTHTVSRVLGESTVSLGKFSELRDAKAAAVADYASLPKSNPRRNSSTAGGFNLYFGKPSKRTWAGTFATREQARHKADEMMGEYGEPSHGVRIVAVQSRKKTTARRPRREAETYHFLANSSTAGAMAASRSMAYTHLFR